MRSATLWILIHQVPQRMDARGLCEEAVSGLGLGSTSSGLRVTPWDVPRWRQRWRAEVDQGDGE